MMKEYKYYAFISYKREDEEWARWVQNKLEWFKLPINSNIDEYIRPVFRDVTDLMPGCLPDRIREALDSSKYLIAICSRKYSKSKWCDEEVKYFKDTGRIRNVIPFIIDGKPYSEDEECFPPTLVELKGTDDEILGADIRTLSNEYALVQIVATMFGVEVDSIWGRYLKEEEAKKRKLKEQNDHLLSLQARITAAKAEELINNWPYDERTAGKLMLEVLPHDILMPDRPWVSEAECVLRKILHKNMQLLEVQLPQKTYPIAFCEKYIAAVQSHHETSMDWATNELITKETIQDYSIGIFQYSKENVNFLYGLLYQHYGNVSKAAFSSDNKYLAFLSNDKLFVIEIESGMAFKEFIKPISSESNRETLKWSGDNRWLVCNNNNLIELFDFKNTINYTVEAHSKSIISLTFDKSGRFLVSVGFDRLVKIWDIQDECHEIFRYACPYFVSCAIYDSISNDLLIAMMGSREKGQMTEPGNLNAQGRNIIRKINIKNNLSDDVILYNTQVDYINKIFVLKALNLLIIEGLGKVYVYNIVTGIKLDEYPDARVLEFIEDLGVLIYVKQNKLEKYLIPSREDLLLNAKREFGSIELSEEVKYRYFIK